MKRLSLSLSILMLGLFLFTACSKEGPAGPQGEDGVNGAPGPIGPAGPAGTSGVLYSAWLDVQFDSTQYPADNEADWGAIITANKLESNVLSQGVVKVYLNVGTAATPTVIEASTIGLTVIFELKRIILTSTTPLLVDDPFSTYTRSDNNQKSFLYRYVLIPGGSAARVANPINWSNYAEVKEYLGLKD